MSNSLKPIPDQYHSITPYIYVKGAGQAIEFYKQAFNAKVLLTMPMPDGRVGHAEIQIGDSVLMLADEFPDMGTKGPQSLGGTSFSFLLYVEDSEDVFEKAVRAGGTVLRPMENKFYGDRSGMITDPFGHQWSISTHVEDVSKEEMERRSKAEMAKEV